MSITVARAAVGLDGLEQSVWIILLDYRIVVEDATDKCRPSLIGGPWPSGTTRARLTSGGDEQTYRYPTALPEVSQLVTIGVRRSCARRWLELPGSVDTSGLRQEVLSTPPIT